ncbi:MAG TPA: VCBS repeat-containing protein, partial [Pirellulales bacterium]
MRLPPLGLLTAIALLLAAQAGRAADKLDFKVQQLDQGLKIGYAVSLVDVNADRRTDIVVVDTNRVIWYENPGWQRHTIIEDQTRLDNVCIAPHDIDGDGQLDFALGAGWQPKDTHGGGTIQWLKRGPSADEHWQVRLIGEEPTVHRMRWADLDGDGRPELVVMPLFGRDTKPPAYAEHGVRVLAYHIPANPLADRWTSEVLNEDLHVTHNFWPTDLTGDGQLDLLVASFEGVSLLEHNGLGNWHLRAIGQGNQTTSPNRGASEVKRGQLAGGRDYIATIEPWHGFQVVVYTPPPAGSHGLWQRHVLDDELKWGHAVWCANLDRDADQELII